MKIIVLLAATTRGGIDFLQSLLDKHTQVLQLPGKFYVDEFLKKIENNKNNNWQIAKLFIELNKEFFDSRLNLVERHDKLGIDKNEFYKVNEKIFADSFIEMSGNKTVSKKDVIVNIHLAYSKASGENLEKKKLLILQIHHLFRINSIKDLDFEILCTIRDPIASHSSYVKNLSVFHEKNINPWQHQYHIERNFSHLIELIKYRKKITVIKLERLHKNNHEVMKNLCSKYDINFENSLQNSTFQGKLWWGDQVSKKDLNGVNKNFENKIHYNVFFSNDIIIIEHFLENFIKSYKYVFTTNEKKTIGIRKYLPFKSEAIIFLQSLRAFNFKNLFMCIFYYFKRLKIMDKTVLDGFVYPKDL